MNNNKGIILALAIMLAIFGVFFGLRAYFMQFMPEYNWYENYSHQSEEPYGFKTLYEILSTDEDNFTLIESRFTENLDTSETNSNYIFLGNDMYCDSLETEHLLKYVQNGNKAFIGAYSSPILYEKLELDSILRNHGYWDEDLSEFIFYNSYYQYNSDSIIEVQFLGEEESSTSYTFHHQMLKDTTNYSWRTVAEAAFEDSLYMDRLSPICRIKNHGAHYFSVSYGKGEFMIYTTPILLTNYYIITEKGFEHTQKVFSHLNNGRTYWDLDSKYASYNYNSSYGGGSSPLRFLFSHYTLRWGWYLLLSTLVIYLLFRSKREQRIIPVLEKNTNTSIEYTKAIGTLYFQEGKHKVIAEEMRNVFLANVRSRYNIPTNLSDEELTDRITQKSGIEHAMVEKIFKQFFKMQYNPMVKADDLSQLHHSIEYFYKNAR